MDPIYQVDRSKEIGLPRSGRPTPDIHACHCPFFAENNGTAGAGVDILRMPDLDIFYCGEGYLLHLKSSFAVDQDRIIVSIILNFSRASTAWGTLAGMITISPVATR